GYVPPTELADEYHALLTELNAELTGMGRITRHAKVAVSRKERTTSGGFLICQLDGWSDATTHEVRQKYNAVLDRLNRLGQPPRIEIRFDRQGSTWTHHVRSLGD